VIEQISLRIPLFLNICVWWVIGRVDIQMPSKEKGRSHSIRPVSRRPPSWCRYQSEEVESFVVKLAKEGHSLSRIGTLLRDQYAIPLVKPITGKSISDILGDAGMAPSMPEDLSNLVKKARGLAVHIDKNHKDVHNKRAMQVIEARIHKLSRYYKRNGVLPKKWKYVSKVASIT
jgi:small subunit ribosomal protein S15